MRQHPIIIEILPFKPKLMYIVIQVELNRLQL